MLSSLLGLMYQAYSLKYSLVPQLKLQQRLLANPPPSKAANPGVSYLLGSATTFADL